MSCDGETAEGEYQDMARDEVAHASFRTQPVIAKKGKKEVIVQTRMRKQRRRVGWRWERDRRRNRPGSKERTTRIHTCHTGVGVKIV